jgi:hypothetical protein
VGVSSSAVFEVEFCPFRERQQPKLREMILVKFWFWSFYFSERDECAPEIRQRQFPSMLRFDATGRVHKRRN